MKICLVSAELTPFAKTGGLGDAVAGLARALAAAGHDVRPFLPAYSSMSWQRWGIVPVDFIRDVEIVSGSHRLTFSLATAPLPGGGPPVYFVHCPGLYERKGIYTGQQDDAGRFAFLARAAIESCQRMGFAADVFHANDWHAALLPLYLRTHYEWDALFRSARTLLTIHNVGYQGTFGSDILGDLGLGGHERWLPADDLAAGSFNFLKTGLWLADGLSTVSPRHALEIQTREYGAGLEDLLRARSGALVGILNGVGPEWDPENDPLLPAHYTREDLRGKAENKRKLLAELGLEARGRTPLLGIVTRLTKQKGIDLFFEVLPALFSQRDVQLVAVGSGEARYERFFAELQERFPRQVVAYRGYSDALAHRVEAAADVFLMPSLYEPCGLNQMYSLKYGTVPVVRATGGLADSVEPYDWRTGEGTGFVFEHYTPEGLAWAIDSALETFKNPAAWLRLQQQGMAKDFSWGRQAERYVEVYARLLGG
jgi:starch synthase